jgi:tRNA (guanine9-N1)-methyltransferase
LVYVIGGIVDHNRLKKITYNYALENGIVVRRLPMKTVHLKASVHLAVNHVWEWMLKKYNGSTWD